MTMSTAEKIGLGIVAVAMATTLLLPGRQTVGVIDAANRFFTGALRTSMGR